MYIVCFYGCNVMCAGIWLVYWHFAAILISLQDNKVESESELIICIICC